MEGGVSCYAFQDRPDLNKVIVDAPLMSSSPVAIGTSPWYGVGGGGWYGSGLHPQKVGYQAYLYRWDGQGWAYAETGPLRTGNTQEALQPVTWDGEAATFFATPSSGAYSVYVHYYWFGADSSVAGTQGGWASEYEQGRSSFCQFV
jgi:hypothetical protein